MSERQDSRLTILTLGGLSIHLDDEPVTGFASRKAEALLVYLACTGRPRPREVLGMLTGDVEARWSAGNITREHARRLWAALPQAAQALLDHGPFLINKAIARSTALNPLAYDGGGSQ